jgi:acetylornithine deacetylase/succinyl-diaminopimelate desuccinylase-like protein
MIPDECVVRVDCRPQPGVTAEEVRAEIDRCIDEARAAEPRLDVTVALADVKPGYLADPDAPVVRLMVDAVVQAGGGPTELVTEDWLGDTASFGQRVPTVIYGPGGAPVYCPDEHLAVADIHQAARVYASYITLALSAGAPVGPPGGVAR